MSGCNTSQTLHEGQRRWLTGRKMVDLLSTAESEQRTWHACSTAAAYDCVRKQSSATNTVRCWTGQTRVQTGTDLWGHRNTVATGHGKFKCLRHSNKTGYLLLNCRQRNFQDTPYIVIMGPAWQCSWAGRYPAPLGVTSAWSRGLHTNTVLLKYYSNLTNNSRNVVYVKCTWDSVQRSIHIMNQPLSPLFHSRSTGRC